MKIPFENTQNRAVGFLAGSMILLIGFVFICGSVTGKEYTMPLVTGTTPIANATVTLTYTRGSISKTAATATTGSNGSFTLNGSFEAGTYTFSFVPAPAYNDKGFKIYIAPFPSWATFNSLKGLLVGGYNLTNSSATVGFKSDSTLKMSLSFGASTISGSLTK